MPLQSYHYIYRWENNINLQWINTNLNNKLVYKLAPKKVSVCKPWWGMFSRLQIVSCFNISITPLRKWGFVDETIHNYKFLIHLILRTTICINHFATVTPSAFHECVEPVASCWNFKNVVVKRLKWYKSAADAWQSRDKLWKVCKNTNALKKFQQS